MRLCPRCATDLRARPEKCPGCGLPIPAAAITEDTPPPQPPDDELPFRPPAVPDLRDSETKKMVEKGAVLGVVLGLLVFVLGLFAGDPKGAVALGVFGTPLLALVCALVFGFVSAVFDRFTNRPPVPPEVFERRDFLSKTEALGGAGPCDPAAVMRPDAEPDGGEGVRPPAPGDRSHPAGPRGGSP
jgi:hypothetical protein